MLSRSIEKYLRINLNNLTLLLVPCYLNSLFRGMEFIADTISWVKLWKWQQKKGENLARSKIANVLLPVTRQKYGSIDPNAVPSSSKNTISKNGINLRPSVSCIRDLQLALGLLYFTNHEPIDLADFDNFDLQRNATRYC